MTTVFDQFAVETTIELSGSMTSQYMVGRSILSSSITVSASIYNVNRRIFTDKSIPVTSSLFTDYKIWRYHDFINVVSGSTTRGTNRFSFCSNNDIIYFDSAMPSMPLVADKSGDFASFALPGINYLGKPDLNATAIQHDDAVDIYISASSPWPVSFPFQSKYKQIPRQIAQTRTLARPTGSLSGSIVSGLHFISIASATLPSWYYSLWFELTSSNNPLTELANNRISGALVNAVPTGFIPMNYDLVKKVFFGTGDGGNLSISASTIALPGFHNMPKFDVYLYLSQSNSNNIYVIMNPRFRGFKFGVLNANPTSPRYVFRRNHFGFVRDLLETPYFSANITSDNITLEYPVTVAFLSGTGVYASSSLDLIASSSTTFNPRDNGQFDIHARVGQPYFDIDPLD